MKKFDNFPTELPKTAEELEEILLGAYEIMTQEAYEKIDSRIRRSMRSVVFRLEDMEQKGKRMVLLIKKLCPVHIEIQEDLEWKTKLPALVHFMDHCVKNSLSSMPLNAMVNNLLISISEPDGPLTVKEVEKIRNAFNEAFREK